MLDNIAWSHKLLQGALLVRAANTMNLSPIGTWGGFREAPQLRRYHRLLLNLAILWRRGMLNRTICSLWSSESWVGLDKTIPSLHGFPWMQLSEIAHGSASPRKGSRRFQHFGGYHIMWSNFAPKTLVADISGTYHWCACMFFEFGAIYRVVWCALTLLIYLKNNILHTDKRNE